jgi:protein-tyrosine phosphatase
MIDLHCHLLPGIDDGAQALEVSFEMARQAVADGISTTACTPHIYPGLFENSGPDIVRRVGDLQSALADADIPLSLTQGADIQMVPELVAGLRAQTMPTLGGSRYFLFEPPHHTVPVGFERLLFDALASGYVPVITHPERLTWLDDAHYPWFVDAARQGAWLQITSGAVTGRFGRRAKYWSERFLDDGVVHILATDAHEPVHRPPLLAEGREAAAHWVGAEEAEALVLHRPRAVLDDADPSDVARPPGLSGQRMTKGTKQGKQGGLFKRWFGGD